MKFLPIIFGFVVVVHSGPVAQDESVVHMVVENFVDCVNSDLSLCLKEHALKAAERLGTVRKLKIMDGVTLLNGNPKEVTSLEPLSAEPEVRGRQLSERLWGSTSELLQNSELEISYAGDDEESRSLEDDVGESRGKKKKQIRKKMKMLIPLVILGKIKAVALVIFALLVIAASVFKLAALAKIAFIIKIISIIKALLAKKHEQEEHGWEPHVSHGPHVEDHGSHGWDGGWARTRTEANNMAYSAYSK